MITAVLACDEEWGIGKDNNLPWPHNSKDLQWFKKVTTGKTVVMGKRTWNSLPVKPLPNRHNIVVTRSMEYAPNVEAIQADIVKSRLMFLSRNGEDVCVIGGAQLVEMLLPIIDEIWLSRIRGTYECDTYLPSALIELTYDLYSSEWDDGVYVDKWRKI
jgi:dihydrofolate reductase